MKILKYILIGIACLVVIILLLGLMMPTDYTVSRTAVVPASKDIVLGQIKSLKEMYNWSPWTHKDPDMKSNYGGTDGEVGSYTEWEGNSDVGKGKMEVTAISDTNVDITVTFREPWETTSLFNFNLAEKDDGTEVTWSMKGTMMYQFNALCLFASMDKMLGPDFEKGLDSLKARAAMMKEARTNGGYEIKETTLESREYFAKRATVKFSEIGKFFQTNLPKMMDEAGKAGMQMNGPTCAIYFSWDKEKQQTDMAAALRFASNTKVPKFKEMQAIILGGKVLQIVYYGDYSNIASAHEAMDAYMKEKNIAYNNLAIEEYVATPMTEKDTAKWMTNIYYLVQ